MSKPIIRIHNVETDEIIDREMTDPEYAAFKEDSEKSLAAFEGIEAKKTEKAALLERLGITEDEAKLLLG
jgi:hypothetical protein